jgi:hypothetical protein
VDLGRADEVGALDHAGPGCAQRLVLAEHRAGGGGANNKDTPLLADAENAGDLLGVDDVLRLHAAGAELDQEVGSPGHDFGGAGGSGEDADGVLDGRWGGITERRHGISLGRAER